MCVDLKSSYLGNQNAYPRNAVDLGARIDGDLCKSEATSTNTGSRKCCECYKRKEGGSDTAGGTAGIVG